MACDFVIWKSILQQYLGTRIWTQLSVITMRWFKRWISAVRFIAWTFSKDTWLFVGFLIFLKLSVYCLPFIYPSGLLWVNSLYVLLLYDLPSIFPYNHANRKSPLCLVEFGKFFHHYIFTFFLRCWPVNAFFLHSRSLKK